MRYQLLELDLRLELLLAILTQSRLDAFAISMSVVKTSTTLIINQFITRDWQKRLSIKDQKCGC